MANNLKTLDGREQDRQWLLAYQAWSHPTLRSCGQSFLAALKQQKFKFLKKL